MFSFETLAIATSVWSSSSLMTTSNAWTSGDASPKSANTKFVNLLICLTMWSYEAGREHVILFPAMSCGLMLVASERFSSCLFDSSICSCVRNGTMNGDNPLTAAVSDETAYSPAKVLSRIMVKIGWMSGTLQFL